MSQLLLPRFLPMTLAPGFRPPAFVRFQANFCDSLCADFDTAA